MGSPATSHRPRPGLLENPALWDLDVSDPEDGEVDGSTDHLASFAAPIVNVRWATTAVSAVLGAPTLLAPQWLGISALLAVTAYSLYRSLNPLRYSGSPRDQAFLLAEVGFFWVLIALTGFWQSPFIIAMSSVLVASGFAGGFRMAMRIGAVTALTITVAELGFTDWAPGETTDAIRWTTLLLLIGMVAGYGRRISGEATRRHSMALGRVGQLNDANTLLFNLHRLAQSLPASLDQNEVLDSSLLELRRLIEFDRALLILVDETDDTLVAARQQAFGITGIVDRTSLPRPARTCLSTWRTSRNSLDDTTPGLHPESRSGLYAPLAARNRLIGLVILESHRQNHFQERDKRLLQGLIEPMALAIDNARWFGRLRRVSVDEERSRIARELHDRVGQTLASLGFDIDGLIRHHDQGDDIGTELGDLRDAVRRMTSEVRETLYDLRSDVREDKDFEQTFGEFAGRVAERSNLTIKMDSEATCRLPIQQEREMWRIAQEALINAERHAAATNVTVRWRCNRVQASLDVIDDGRGMTEKNAGRADSYGIVGMRERADSIGAALEIISKPGEGTTVRCYLNQI
ncbi:MAG: histidine kinase [Actinomycetota bacterium]